MPCNVGIVWIESLLHCYSLAFSPCEFAVMMAMDIVILWILAMTDTARLQHGKWVVHLQCLLLASN